MKFLIATLLFYSLSVFAQSEDSVSVQSTEDFYSMLIEQAAASGSTPSCWAFSGGRCAGVRFFEECSTGIGPGYCAPYGEKVDLGGSRRCECVKY